MSDFLTLCQDLHREVGGAGSAPAAVTGQTGQSLRTVNWIKNAYTKIQNKHANWRWMRHEWSWVTTIGDPYINYDDGIVDGGSLSLTTRFGRWILEVDGVSTTRVYLTSAGIGASTWMTPVSWDQYRASYLLGYGSIPASGSPSVIAIDPQNRLRLAATPDASYTILGEHQRSAQVLAANTDEPEMPERFHELIVWEAMKRYARFVAAPEVYADAKIEAGQMMRDLEVDQLPEPKFAPPLA